MRLLISKRPLGVNNLIRHAATGGQKDDEMLRGLRPKELNGWWLHGKVIWELKYASAFQVL